MDKQYSEPKAEARRRQLAEARAMRGVSRTGSIRSGKRGDDGDDDDDLIPDAEVARGRYKVHPITLSRWDADPDLGFPAAIEINGRRYRRRRELVAWERSRVVARTKQTAA
jgi:hypothetical protein